MVEDLLVDLSGSSSLVSGRDKAAGLIAKGRRGSPPCGGGSVAQHGHLSVKINLFSPWQVLRLSHQ